MTAPQSNRENFRALRTRNHCLVNRQPGSRMILEKLELMLWVLPITIAGAFQAVLEVPIDTDLIETAIISQLATEKGTRWAKPFW